MPRGPGTDAPVEPPVAKVHSKHRVARWLAMAAGALLLSVGVAQGVRFLQLPPQVAVVAAEQGDVARMLAVTGRVEATQSVLVSPQFAGRITEVVRHEGDRVKSGEVLARLADVSAKSDVVQQEAALSSKQHDLAQALRDMGRTASLVASGATAPAELEASRLLVARASDEVRRLSALLQDRRSQLTLLAPFDGTIVRREGELGQVVGPQNAVFEIATVDTPRVSAEVDERYVRALRPGMRAEILSTGADDSKRSAQVSYVAQAVDPGTGAATVRFAYEQAPRDLLVGLSVDVNISVGTTFAAITIPREAVGGGADHPFVLVVIDGLVARRTVTVDDWPAALVVVRAGLRKGELALLDPKGAVVGMRVRSKVAPDVP
jgi:membrane fusion protein (multidrug efflux system)